MRELFLLVEQLVLWLVSEWSAIIWTFLGALGFRWHIKLLKRWVPAYHSYRERSLHRSVPIEDLGYAWSRMMKAITLTIMGVLVVGLGVIVLLGPAGQGNPPTWRSYTFVVAFLIIDAGISFVAFLMNKEDEM